MKRNEVWEAIIRDLGLEEIVVKQRFCYITATQLRPYGEPRLLAKMDSLSDIPHALKLRNWSLLAVSNDRYILGELGVHFQLPPSTAEFETFSWESPFETINQFSVSGESEACLVALHSGIISDFLGGQFHLTSYGRIRTDSYPMLLTVGDQHVSIDVSGVQFEVDAGFESEDKVVLLEMKKIPSSSMNLRQLYFPFRHWLARTGKLVVPVFGVWTRNSLDLFRFNFPHHDDISSAEIVHSKRYTFAPNMISVGLLEVMAAEASMKRQDSIYPFPQADDVGKLLQLLDFLSTRKTLTAIAEHLRVDLRQAAYYCNALGFLGLASRADDNQWGILEEARSGGDSSLVHADESRSHKLIRRMLNVPPIGRVFLQGNSYSRGSFTEANAIESLKNSDWGSSLGELTIARRARTILSWCRWIDSQVKS